MKVMARIACSQPYRTARMALRGYKSSKFANRIR